MVGERWVPHSKENPFISQACSIIATRQGLGCGGKKEAESGKLRGGGAGRYE